jgi:hypothetical protein
LVCSGLLSDAANSASFLHQCDGGFAATVCIAVRGAKGPTSTAPKIRLLPSTTPVAIRPYLYAHNQKQELKKQCAEMLGTGVIRPNTSAFSVSMLLVKKGGDSWWFCVDFRALNAVTVKDKFPIPVVEELLDELRGATFFSKLDLRSGYHQVLMHPDDVEKTMFRTPESLFEFLVMPFGLTNTPTTFQALINYVLRPFLCWFVLVFFNDILIYSSSWSEHLRHVQLVMEKMEEHSLFIKHSKCVFDARSVAYLGHVISKAGIAMDQQKLDAVLDWLVPRSVCVLRTFLGIVGYYRRFIRDYKNLLCKDAFWWSPEVESNLRALPRALTEAPMLQLPVFDKVFIIECDASGSGFNAVLHQGHGLIAFFNHQIMSRHAKLVAYECKLVGLVQVVRHWWPYLWGCEFMGRTDHYSLKFHLDQHLSIIPQHRWASKLLGFDFIVEFKSGSTNVVTITLSRRDIEDGATLLALSAPSFEIFDDLR